MLDIALVQWVAGGNDRAKQLARAIDATRQAAGDGADIVVFPEMWLVSYTSNAPADDDRPDLWRDPAQGPAGEPLSNLWDGLDVSLDSPEIATMRDLARELNVAILFTFLQTWPGGPRNAAALIDRHGEIKLVYAKAHLCVFSADEYGLTAGDDFPVAELDTEQGPVRIGVMICYDREFPESARLLMLNGAEIVLVPNACDMNDHRLMQLSARATENMTGMAMANYAGEEWGQSVAYDGIAYADGPRDTTVVLADEGEEIVHACFDLAALRDYRERETWGNAFRRPELYAKLAERAAQSPFVRVNAAGQRWDARDTAAKGDENDL